MQRLQSSLFALVVVCASCRAAAVSARLLLRRPRGPTAGYDIVMLEEWCAGGSGGKQGDGCAWAGGSSLGGTGRGTTVAAAAHLGVRALWAAAAPPGATQALAAIVLCFDRVAR